jgi:hypothetical protein
MWMVLRHFRKRTSARQIIRRCRHTKKTGTFTIAMAVALRESGLQVEFHTDRDADPRPIERQLYTRAKQLNIQVCDPLTIEQLAARIRGRTIAIVYYDTDEHNGHFSPLIAFRNSRLILPYSDCGSMQIAEFEAKWSAPKICRQCIIISR